MDMLILYSAGIGVLGLVLGSFAGAQVWRLRAHQLQEDREVGEDLTEEEKAELRRLSPLLKKTMREDRSRCLHCKHELGIKDLIPLASWLSTRGRCRYCHKTIGTFEPLIELGTAFLFVVSYIFWPLPFVGGPDIALFVAWLVALVLFVILFAYDLKWFLLPDKIVWPLVVLGAVFASTSVVQSTDTASAVLSLAGAVFLLSGLYALLYYYSLLRSGGKTTWVGFGDVKLGLVLALFLADWKLAFLALFLANFIGTLIVVPALVFKLLSRKAHVPFGPLLIIGFFITFIWGEGIVNWFLYNSNMLVLY